MQTRLGTGDDAYALKCVYQHRPSPGVGTFAVHGYSRVSTVCWCEGVSLCVNVTAGGRGNSTVCTQKRSVVVQICRTRLNCCEVYGSYVWREGLVTLIATLYWIVVTIVGYLAMGKFFCNSLSACLPMVKSGLAVPKFGRQLI